MLEATLAPLEAEVVTRSPTIESPVRTSFTPLPEGFHQTMTQVPEFKPPLVTEAQSYKEPSIANSVKPDYIAELTDELKQMAQQQGLDPNEQIPGENPATELPQKKISIGQRIKNLFKRAWSWSRHEIDNFFKKWQGNKVIPTS
jgi:hypothetical protein